MHCRRFKGNIKFSRASKLSTQYLEGVILISHLLNNLSRSFHNLYMHKRVLWGQMGDALKCTEGAGRGLTKPLSIFHQMSWLSRKAPEVTGDRRLTNVTPSYKKGCKEDPGNFRPAA